MAQSHAEQCATCAKPLVVSIDEDEDDLDLEEQDSAQLVPDDVHLLACGHHFHWLCLLDAFSVTSCPSCNTNIVTSAPSNSASSNAEKILCNIRNEGGFQESVDILPELAEESYLKAYPEERRARAFLHFCRQGDLQAILSTLQDDDDDDEDSEDEDPLAFDILRYQDQLQDQQSALHCAVISGNPEVAWLLLYLASDLPLDQFPPALLEQAQALNLERSDNTGKVDIRRLKDTPGRTAEGLAAEVGGPWQDWLSKGRLEIQDDQDEIMSD